MILALALAASTPGPAPGGSEPPTVVVYATPVTQPELWDAGEGPVIAKFEAEHPEIRVQPRRIPFENYDTQIELSVRGGNPPDVARINHVTLPMWAGAGYLLPLDEFIAASDVIDPKDYWRGFYEIGRIGGKTYAVPLGTDCRVLFYNKTLFDRAGLTPPRTWPELVDAARRLTDRQRKVYGIAFPANDEWSAAYDTLGDFLVANDGYLLNAAGTHALVTSNPRVMEAFRFVTGLSTEQRVCPPGAATISGDVINALFVKDRLGMMMTGPWARAAYEQLRPDMKWGVHYDTALIPASPRTGHSGSSQGGWLIGVFAKSPRQRAALALMEFLSRPESLATIAAAENLPVREAAARLGPFRDPFYHVFFEQLKHARPPFRLGPHLPNLARLYLRAYQRVVAGGASADEAARWLEDRLNNHLLR
jgi:multiple sugar transport system substrate-binding protein